MDSSHEATLEPLFAKITGEIFQVNLDFQNIKLAAHAVKYLPVNAITEEFPVWGPHTHAPIINAAEELYNSGTHDPRILAAVLAHPAYQAQAEIYIQAMDIPTFIARCTEFEFPVPAILGAEPVVPPIAAIPLDEGVAVIGEDSDSGSEYYDSDLEEG